jgi:hypothetical protein
VLGLAAGLALIAAVLFAVASAVQQRSAAAVQDEQREHRPGDSLQDQQ